MGTRQSGSERCARVPGRFSSLSWAQPPSTGISGWEGHCGQTCVSNLLANSRPSRMVPPRAVNFVATDATPGSHPGTVRRALRMLSPGRRYELSYERAAIAEARTNRPVGCLLQWEAGVLHWVTVVGTAGDRVVFNHWGDQDSLSRTEFESRWGFRARRFSDAALAALGGIWAWTSIG